MFLLTFETFHWLSHCCIFYHKKFQVPISGRSRKEADGMELVVCGLILIVVGLSILSVPTVILIMNTSFLTLHKPLLNTIQIFIIVRQEIILQGVLLLLTTTIATLIAINICVAEAVMLIYLGAQCHWIILLTNLWY